MIRLTGRAFRHSLDSLEQFLEPGEIVENILTTRLRTSVAILDMPLVYHTVLRKKTITYLVTEKNFFSKLRSRSPL